MSTLSGNIKLSATATILKTRDLGSAALTEAIAGINQAITNGSGANQATQVWGDKRTLSASSSEELDLNGTLVNGLGDTVHFTRVIGFIVQAAAANGGTITVGGAATNAWAPWAGAVTHTVKINPGGAMMFFAPDATGLPVTAGTADLLKIENDDSGASATYDIWLLGSEA